MSFSYHLHCVVIFILNQRKDYYRTSDRSSSYIRVLIAFNLSYHSLPKCAVYSRIYVRSHCYPNTSKTYIVVAVNINSEGRKLEQSVETINGSHGIQFIKDPVRLHDEAGTSLLAKQIP